LSAVAYRLRNQRFVRNVQNQTPGQNALTGFITGQILSAVLKQTTNAFLTGNMERVVRKTGAVRNGANVKTEHGPGFAGI